MELGEKNLGDENMGSSLNVHIGAYLVVKTKKEMKTIETKYCEKHSHMRLTSDFCPNCGKPTTIKTEKKPCYPTLGDLEEVDDIMWLVDKLHEVPLNNYYNTSEIIATGNQQNDFTQVDDSAKVFEITPEIMDGCVSNFKTVYEDVITYLTHHNKVENVDVTFGVLQYWW